MTVSELSLSLFNPVSGPILTASLVESEDNAHCSCEEVHRRQFASAPWGEPYTLHILCRSTVTRKLAWDIYDTYISNLSNSQLNQEMLLWDMKRICECQGSVDVPATEDSDQSMDDDMNMDDVFPRWTPTGTELSVPFIPSTQSGSGTSSRSNSRRREFFIPPHIRKAMKDEEKKSGSLRKYLNGEIINAIRENLRPYFRRRSPRPNALRTGYIYILAADSCPGFLKIGFSEDKPDIRRKQIQKCFEDAHVVYEAGVLISHARKIEKLVHQELQGLCRWINCDRCGTGHREWFEVDLDLAKQVVMRWSQWMTRDPYNQNGALNEAWKILVTKALKSNLEPGIDNGRLDLMSNHHIAIVTGADRSRNIPIEDGDPIKGLSWKKGQAPFLDLLLG